MTIHPLRKEIRERNEQKWACVPKYIDYLLANQRFERPIAVSIDIDGYNKFHMKSHTIAE